MSVLPPWVGHRRVLLPVALAVSLLGLISLGFAPRASAQEETPASVKGQLKGGEYLMNLVWQEAADPKNHRFTFRRPSATVNKEAKKLRAYLPKEVTVAALGPGAMTSERMVVSGGRTTPVTLVVAPGTTVQLQNADPHLHELYTVKAEGGLAAAELKGGAQRTWKAPTAEGTYEVRDRRFPSVRSFLVVKTGVAAVALPKLDGGFVVKGLKKNTKYSFQAFFNGEPKGKPVELELSSNDSQDLPRPLVIGFPPSKEKSK